MNFDCTNRFNSDIQRLLDCGYSSVREEIKGFKNKFNSFQEFFELPTLLIPSSEVRTIKHRLKDSANRRGTSSGFRLIFIANKKTQTITFCHVYPKIGSMGKISASKSEVTEIIGEYISQHKLKLLSKVNFFQQETEQTLRRP